MSIDVQLSFSGDSLLQARATNTGSAPIRFVHQSGLQPSRLVLRDGRGVEIRPFDNREISKFDRTVYDHSFLTLDPGEETDLGYAIFVQLGSGTYRAAWGPFEFENVQPGEYSARVVFASRIDAPTDSPERTPIAGVWTGTAESRMLRVRLP